jgi:GNAT superfamily N-acetyltransferase
MSLRGLTIRKFRTENARKVAAIISNSLEAAGINYPEEVTPKLVLNISNNRKMFVALKENTIVGTACIDHDVIAYVFADEQYKNQGVESALTSLLEEVADNNGIRQIRLEALKGTEKIFEKLGYSLTDEVASNEFGSCVIMEKYLI